MDIHLGSGLPLVFGLHPPRVRSAIRVRVRVRIRVRTIRIRVRVTST